MNNVVLVGRIVKDPELRYVGSSNSPLTSFTIAVKRRFKSQDGTIKSDLINVDLWGKQAEVFSKYLSKGQMVSIEGELRVDIYETTTGEKKNISKVVASRFDFIGSKDDIDKMKNKDTEKESDKFYTSAAVFETEYVQEENLPF